MPLVGTLPPTDITDSSADLAGTVNTQGLPGVAWFAWGTTEQYGNMTEVVTLDEQPTYQQTVLADSAISYWRLDEKSGTTALDQRGISPGTYTGGFTLSEPGSLDVSLDPDPSIKLDGVSGNVTIPWNANLPTGAGPFSVEAWVNTDWANPVQTVFAFNNGSSLGITFRLSSGGNLLSVSLDTTTVASSIALPPSAWAHVVATYDGTTLRVYVNGAPAGSGAASPIGVGTDGQAFIGWNLAVHADYYSGLIDEVAIYGSALSAAQVLNHYTVATTAPAAPSAPWPLTFTAILRGLTFGLTYHIAAVGRSAGGTVYGSDVTFIAELPEVVQLAGDALIPFSTPIDNPHLAYPLQMSIHGALVYEQNSIQEVYSDVRLIADCFVGECFPLPQFGIPNPTFDLLPLGIPDIVGAIQSFEPRADEAAVVGSIGNPDLGEVGLNLTTRVVGSVQSGQ